VVPVAAAVLAVGLFAAGMIAWRMMSPVRSCPDGYLCGLFDPNDRYQLHPLRAEALWALSGVFAVLAIASAFTSWLRRSSAVV
jgi:hypothetical protein